MTTLNWREASEVHLTRMIIPGPNGQRNLQELRNVRVAVEGAFLNIDPRQIGAAANGSEPDIYIIPATMVEYVKYTAAIERHPAAADSIF